ncbi:hypothetical protein R1flu_006098 [Riccia fluitans]|uniref:Transposase n=1 Tax=Riccia fluitans TaxID=41844 RepID=A0ABD1YW31_9MARC
MRIAHGEVGSVVFTEEVWDQFNAVKASLSGYEQRDIFSMDETGLFFKPKPNRKLANASVAGEKKDKTRVTVASTANMDGGFKFPPLIILKSLMPRAFGRRSIKTLENLGIH